MVNTKLISVRLEKDVLTALDEIANKASYRKRSACLNRILKCVLTCASEDAVSTIVDTHDPFGDGLKLHLLTTRFVSNH